MSNTLFRLPKQSEQTTIVGRNGSGKTQGGVWLLSQADLKNYPFIIVDYKHDELINSIEGARGMDIGDKMPKHPGLYIVHPQVDDEDGITDFLWKLWAKENTGLMIDEGYMIHKNNKAMNAIFTQGRSKNIQRIVLSQRPAYISRFAVSEANHYMIYHLNDDRDNKIIESFLPDKLDSRLPKYHARWYDVNEDKSFLLKPVPQADKILATFEEKLKPKKKFSFFS